MTVNRREADFVWIDEDSDIDYDEVWRTQPRLEAAPIEAASYDVAADGWGTEVRMRREGDGRITVLSTRREPPGLARNRRARERWVAMTPDERSQQREDRLSGYWWPQWMGPSP